MVSKKKPVFDMPIRIRFSGQYDYDGLLDLMRSFFRRHLFDMQETKFKYKTGGSGSEVDFAFKGEKDITHYLRVHMDIGGKIFDVKRNSVVIDGKQKMMTGGRIDVRINGSYELDFANMYGSEKSQKKIEKFMQDQLDNDPEGLQFYEMKKNGKKYMEKTMMSFSDEIKTFLGMETMKK
jgi:hypothetical protein